MVIWMNKDKAAHYATKLLIVLEISQTVILGNGPEDLAQVRTVTHSNDKE